MSRALEVTLAITQITQEGIISTFSRSYGSIIGALKIFSNAGMPDDAEKTLRKGGEVILTTPNGTTLKLKMKIKRNLKLASKDEVYDTSRDAKKEAEGQASTTGPQD